MIKTSYDFEQAILPAGNSFKTNLLLPFRADIPESPRRNLNLSLVIARSCSMAGSSLHHALKAAESVVEQLEPAANGNFYFIQSIDEATEVLSIELDSLRAVVGQNLVVTLELAEGVGLVDTLL